MAISDWSVTPASNASVGSINFAEGQAPSTVNNSARQLMADLKEGLFNAPTDVASAATTNLGAVASNYCNITGTTTITSFGTVSSGIWKFVKFAGALTLTHNGTSLILPAGANITTAAGDTLLAVSEGSGNWRVLFYQRKDGTPVADPGVDPLVNDFRLTLTAGVPVTTADVTGATTIYCAPYKGNRIALYDGSAWNIRTSAEFSLALGTLTSGLPYDVFCYDDSGTPTLEFLAWTDDTTRATALSSQDGILVKSGDATRRYLGTFYTTSTTTTEDSATKRYVWNYYNRARRHLYRFESAISWNYTTNAWRQANNSAANQVEWICGVAEDAVDINICVSGSNTAFSWAAIGIGIDSVSAPTRGAYMAPYPSGSSASVSYSNTLLGRHYASWLERAQATGTMSWYGADATLVSSSGLTGILIG